MRKISQSRSGIPHGDCTRACIASILELSLEDVPDPRWPADVEFKRGTPESEAALKAAYQIWLDWLAKYNLALVCVLPGGWFPRPYYIAGVQSPRGPHHVVAQGDEIVWDPSPHQDSYDTEIEDCTFFVSLDPSTARRDRCRTRTLYATVKGIK